MSKSVIYAANTATQDYVATGTVVNFGSIVRRYGGNLGLSGGNIIADGIGYYNADVNLSLTGAGTISVQVYKDGAPITGAEATITGVADTTYSVTIPCLIRQTCCCESTITVVVSGTTGTITNAAIVVEKE